MTYHQEFLQKNLVKCPLETDSESNKEAFQAEETQVNSEEKVRTTPATRRRCKTRIQIMLDL